MLPVIVPSELAPIWNQFRPAFNRNRASVQPDVWIQTRKVTVGSQHFLHFAATPDLEPYGFPLIAVADPGCPCVPKILTAVTCCRVPESWGRVASIRAGENSTWLRLILTGHCLDTAFEMKSGMRFQTV